MPKPWRYNDEARVLDESLADIKVAQPVRREPDIGGLDRIISGNTALASLPAEHAAAQAGVPNALKEHAVRQKLRSLLAEKQKKVASFLERMKRADLMLPDITPSQMTSGTGQPIEQDRDRDIKLQRLTANQGPAANLIAAGLKALNNQQSKLR